ncbi:ChaN family lipoprotein [Hydrogenophaga sp. PAMC20947]|uniref:ChaN family lipoprotein n=1 Tax=Hydrogenophaga sp. PAMC20947 TaxID=2565558 RepID=UPI00109DED86|nr:ChaN family lipoprotein [Hydrogenophaga sp. PAMC20947]QCB47177.1 hypothetical protein E5678_14780 [Hydrogenophaga sp. PAMC20947]
MHCRLAVTLITSLSLAACSLWQQTVTPTELPPAMILLLGEQHDADAHQTLQRKVVIQLGREGRLEAVVLEMAEQGRDTRGLPARATEALVRERLQWDDEAWPWRRYGPVVMSAVRAEVPVVGGNLPRAAMVDVMRDPSRDAALDDKARARQTEDIRLSHCGLLPESQLPGMVRIQIARDQALAGTVAGLVKTGHSVVLIAGARHVARDLGVPRHWRPALRAEAHVVLMQAGGDTTAPAEGADVVWATPALPEKDHCADLRARWAR